jgi:hypothetical protein
MRRIESLVGSNGHVTGVLEPGELKRQPMSEAATQVDLSITRAIGPIAVLPSAGPERVVNVRPYLSVLPNETIIRPAVLTGPPVAEVPVPARHRDVSGRAPLKPTDVGKERPARHERANAQDNFSSDLRSTTPNWDSEESDEDGSEYELSEIDPDSDSDSDDDDYGDLGENQMPDGGPLLPQSNFSDFPEGYARQPPRMSNPPWPVEVLDFMIARYHTEKRTLIVENVEKAFSDEFRSHHQITSQRIITWVSSYGRILKEKVKMAISASATGQPSASPAGVHVALPLPGDSKTSKRSAAQVLGAEVQAEGHVRKRNQSSEENCANTQAAEAGPSSAKADKGSNSGTGSRAQRQTRRS